MEFQLLYMKIHFKNSLELQKSRTIIIHNFKCKSLRFQQKVTFFFNYQNPFCHIHSHFNNSKLLTLRAAKFWVKKIVVFLAVLQIPRAAKSMTQILVYDCPQKIKAIFWDCVTNRRTIWLYEFFLKGLKKETRNIPKVDKNLI